MDTSFSRGIGSYAFESDRTSSENCGLKNFYQEVQNIRIYPKELIMTNPFEGKMFKERIVIRNCGKPPVLIRILDPSSSGIHIKTIKHGSFLCSGMFIKRTVTYQVQMMTLIKSCVIPIYINDDIVDYPVKIIMTPVNLLIVPDVSLDFGKVDASLTPAKRSLTIINSDVKPARFFIDLGPNELELVIDPSRGIILGENSAEISISVILMQEGVFKSEFWIMAENPTCIHVRATVGFPRIEPLFTFKMKSFTFIQFPITYYGTTSVRSIVMHNNSQTQSFFCVMGEIELETFTLKEVKTMVHDYKFFKINPEEGRLLANDIRVFRISYTPVTERNALRHDYNLVMMRIKRLNYKDLNPSDYSEEVYKEPKPSTSTTSQTTKKISNVSSLSEECETGAQLELGAPATAASVRDGISLGNEVRLMLYGQVEEVSVSVLPDSLKLTLEIGTVEKRVLQLQNNSTSLPIMFRYRKIVFIEIEPKVGIIQATKSIEVAVIVKPKSLSSIQTKIVFDLLYYNEPREDDDLALVGTLKIPCNMHFIDKVVEKASKCEKRLVKNFEFKKPNQKPNDMVMKVLRQGKTYVALPDDVANNLPDSKLRMYKSIYSAMPRYQTFFNEYALTDHDRVLLKVKNYYNIYIGMGAKKKNVEKKQLAVIPVDKCNKMKKHLIKALHDDEDFSTLEFIPLTPIQLALVDLSPRSFVVENVAFHSTFMHTLLITNKNHSFLKIYLKPHKSAEYNFIKGTRLTIPPNSEKETSFMLYIGATPLHNYELDVIINNCFVLETSVVVKARPKHLKLSVEILTFFENEPPNKFVELHNELNVDISFQWKVPSVFTVDPVYGEVVSGRFVACMISFEIGLAENMVYDLGVHTENKFYNLKVLIEGTDYKVKLPKILSFGEMSLNMPCYKTLPLSNMSQQFLSFEINEEHMPDGVKVKPREGRLMPLGIVNLTICANRSFLGDIAGRMEVVIAHRKRITCELSGTVVFPQISFQPEVLRFRKMAASSFDIACITVINTSSAVAIVSFDTDRFPEFSYSEYTNSEFMSNKDVILVHENEEKQFSIHFYPYNPLVTSFPLPININNKIGAPNKSKTLLMWKPNVKVHAQVLSYKLEVKSWRYNFIYFPHFGYRNVTSHTIRINNPCKVPITFCIRLDELVAPFNFGCKVGAKITNYDCSIVVELQPDECAIFEAMYEPKMPGTHTLRLPVYVKDDFTEDMHNYFYFVGEYPAATYKYSEDAVYMGFVPFCFTISKKIVIDMAYHHPTCNCVAYIEDTHCHVEIDNVKPKNTMNCKIVQIIFSSARPQLLNTKLEMSCECPGPNLELDIFGGCENNYFTVHACIQYFRCNSSMSFNAIFEPNESEILNMSTITIQDPEREEALKHNFKTDLPYFQSGTDLFDVYMEKVVAIFEKWLLEQVFFGTRSFSIPDTICIPDIRLFDKQGKREGVIRLPLQLMLNHLLGTSIMSQFEIKYTEKKPLWQLMRKFYREILNFLLSVNCFVNQIKPEWLLPYDYYKEFMSAMEPKRHVQSPRNFYLIAKQSWLDLLMQSYKSLVARRSLQFLATSLNAKNSTSNATKSSHGSSVSFYGPSPMSHRYGVSVLAGTIFSEEGVMLLGWVDKHFQDHKLQLASAKYGNKITDEFRAKHIENFDEDLSDGLGIVSVIMTHCGFLEEMMMGIYAPATNRMEKFNNAYIVIKILSLLQVSFHIQPIDIIEPNIVHMLMFLTYLYEFLIPLKNKETISFAVELAKSKQETIGILNENKHRIYYNIIFFNNTDDLFSVNESTICIEPDQPFKLAVTYNAKFIRVQKTIMLLSGEIPGYQYTNSKIYFLEGRPDIVNAGETLKATSTIYKITQVQFDFKSPYPMAASYDIYVASASTDVNQLAESLIPFSSVLKTKTLTRVKLDSAVAQADDNGHIIVAAQLCSIIKTNQLYWLVLRHREIGDFIIKLDVSTKPMKAIDVIKLTMQKSLIHYPCTCPRKHPDVHNNKCPRNVKIMIPSRNEYMWKSVMEFFLSDRDSEENDFWEIYKRTPIGSHIVKRILYDHKKFLSTDMDYFMSHSFNYLVSVKNCDTIVTQKTKTIKQALIDTTTEVLVHFNSIVHSFHLILASVDEKETRIFKVRVSYE